MIVDAVGICYLRLYLSPSLFRLGFEQYLVFIHAEKKIHTYSLEMFRWFKIYPGWLIRLINNSKILSEIQEYIDNGDIFTVYFNGSGEVLGRALVWKLASVRRMRKEVEGIEYFMDRQYTIKESDVQKFRNYAEKEGWAYKAYNNHHSYSTIKFNGEELGVHMQVHVAAKRYDNYPYMDTFRRYNPENGVLYNDDNNSTDEEGCYILDDTGGGYNEVEGGVYSEWNDCTIPEDEAVYSDYVDSYLYRDQAVEVTRGSRRNRGWYPEDHDDLCRAYDGNYYNINDTIYSDIYNDHIYEDDAMRVVTDIYSDGDVNSPDDSWMSDDDRNVVREREYNKLLWYEFLSDRFSDWSDFSGCHKDLLIKDSNDNWIPKMFETKVYRVAESKDDNPVDIMGTEYLLEVDADILGYSVDKSNENIIDMFQYSEDINHLLKDIQERVQPLIKSYEDILDGKGQQRMKFDEEEERQYFNKIQKLKDKCIERLEEIDNDKYYIIN